jgi:CBS domain containing-hemolysin-like protein
MKLDPATIAALITALTSLVGAPLIQVIKEQLGIQGKAAVGLTTGVAIALAVLVQVVNGELAGFDFTLDAVKNVAALIFTVATIFYKLFMGQPAAAKPKAIIDPTDEG